MTFIDCKICGTPKRIKPSFLGRLATCGSSSCKKEYRSREVSNRGVFWRMKISSTAKQNGVGKWMQGRVNHLSDAARQSLSHRWTGTGNPRWKGGMTLAQSHKKWIQAHPENVHHYRQVRRARHNNATGAYSLGEWLALKRAYLYTCPACARTEPDIKLTVDHIVPLSRGGSNFISNIQPLCSDCNTKKWAHTMRFDSSLIVAKFINTPA